MRIVRGGPVGTKALRSHQNYFRITELTRLLVKNEHRVSWRRDRTIHCHRRSYIFGHLFLLLVVFQQSVHSSTCRSDDRRKVGKIPYHVKTGIALALAGHGFTPSSEMALRKSFSFPCMVHLPSKKK